MSVKLMQNIPQSLSGLFIRMKQDRLEINGQAVSKHGLHENSQRFHVNPGTETFAEVYLQPSH